ncbi:archaeal proteasome endopeptidase complex subunit alpha [Natronorubrum sp. JWXQ-INN-674]|uniref:Proteasome subunit alpha n=1 Tax=Natronorubrum halalkaliphilum TaxID=2691917 RepID=A0A6B0VQU8_9EURY|nr:archaeal proteasome endopeptidase complex subunit alpha [Natronorubrum halalkaliphilum]MXV63386.1 archaeal proteasome endopeptidase complex subunit alpha [Natronorubrum halalkaliphilum]
MQGQSQQQAYDRGITIFSPDGRLYQVEYAREAVKRGTASVGIRTPAGVVLAADRQVDSSLMEPSSVEKIHKADDHVGIASAGHVADARRLVDLARRRAQGEQLRYGQTIGVETLTRAVTDHIQEYTQTGGARPFGVALLVGGVEDGEPRLLETDPSGTDYEWQAAAIGSNRDVIQGFLEERYRPDLDLDGGLELALSALSEPEDDPVNAGDVDVATIGTDDETFRSVPEDRLESILAEIDGDESDE